MAGSEAHLLPGARGKVGPEENPKPEHGADQEGAPVSPDRELFALSRDQQPVDKAVDAPGLLEVVVLVPEVLERWGGRRGRSALSPRAVLGQC